MLMTSILSLGAKSEAAGLMWRIRRGDPKQYANLTVREWLDGHVRDEPGATAREAAGRARGRAASEDDRQAGRAGAR